MLKARNTWRKLIVKIPCQHCFLKIQESLNKVIATTPPAEAACTNSHKPCSQTNNVIAT